MFKLRARMHRPSTFVATETATRGARKRRLTGVWTGVFTAASLMGFSLPAGPASAQTSVPTCFGKRATMVGTAGDDRLVGTSRADVIAGLGGDDEIIGKGGADLICGGGGSDVISGGGGDDRLNGGAGDDIVFGQGGDDLMNGGRGIDILVGMQGNDRYTGGAGIDLAAFLASPTAVTVDLETGSAAGEGRDILYGMEGAIGSSFDDIIFGDSATNVLLGGPGNDFLDGGAGSDFVFFTLAPAAEVVDLTEGQALGGEGTDYLDSIENVVGSPYNDTLIGTSNSNYMNGAEGSDTVDGHGGNDTCFGEDLHNCPVPLPTTSEPPPPPESSSIQGGRLLDRVSASLADPKTVKTRELYQRLPLAAPFVGGLSCPFLTGSFRLVYPSFQGYGHFAYRLYGGTWVYSPLLYYQSYWEANFAILGWQPIDPYNSHFVGQTNQTVEAYYWHWANGQWNLYFMGQCTTAGFSPGT